MSDNKATSFSAKLSASIEQRNSLLCVGLDPVPDQMPERYRNGDNSVTDALLAWNLALIGATAPYTAAYKPNIAFYEALGPDGYTLLRRTIDAIPPGYPIILDAKRGDIGNTAAAYAKACFEHWGVDAVTLSPYLGRDSLQPFLAYEDKGLFVLCRTSNPGSADFQELEISDWRTLDREPNQPLFMHVAKSATAWSSSVGLVVGATFPESLAEVRRVAPQCWILVPGVGAQGGDLEATLAAGLRADGAGLLINASRGVAQADDPAEAARDIRDQINQYRTGATRPTPQKAIAQSSAYDALFASLVELEAVKFGEFTLASGIQSPIYIDLRLLVSQPSLLAQVAGLYAGLLGGLSCDRIAGVPYAALPIGTAVSLHAGMPLIYPRKEAKAYGLGRDIEGAWSPGERVVIVEDLITSGGSTLKTAERLRAAGLVVEHALVLIDREQGGPEHLADHGIAVHSVFKLSAMLDSLVRQGLISAERAESVRAFIREQRTA